MKFLDTLFFPDDRIFFDRMSQRGSGLEPLGSMSMAELDTAFSSNSELPEFFVINPIREGSTRTADRVTRFQNWLLEFDAADLETQLAGIYKLSERLPLASVTFSGSKSYHVLISLQDTCPLDPSTEIGQMQYRAVWKALARFTELETGLVADPSTKNPNRLSRTPGARRSSNGALQEPLPNWKPRYAPFDELMLLLRPHFQTTTFSSPVSASTTTLRAFKTAINRHEAESLRLKLDYPSHWAGPTNMYPELFRYTLWAIDITGCTQEVLLAYMQEHTFPTIRSMGYPRDLEYPVKKAYEWKRFTAP